MYIIIFVILLIICFVFSNVVAYTELKDKKFAVRVFLWKIKLFDNTEKKINKSKTEEINNTKEAEKNTKNKLTIDSLTKYFKVIKEISEDIKKMFKYFKRKVKGKEFNLDITFGLLDAAETGIATGMIWAFIGSVYPVVDTIIEISDPHISVNPKFNCEYLNIEYKGIYKLKIIHIIYIAYCVLKLILKYKKVIKDKNLNGGV